VDWAAQLIISVTGNDSVVIDAYSSSKVQIVKAMNVVCRIYVPAAG
jgi:hypothetical protein